MLQINPQGVWVVNINWSHLPKKRRGTHHQGPPSPHPPFLRIPTCLFILGSEKKFEIPDLRIWTCRKEVDDRVSQVLHGPVLHGLYSMEYQTKIFISQFHLPLSTSFPKSRIESLTGFVPCRRLSLRQIGNFGNKQI
jgi:hypothetical protein